MFSKSLGSHLLPFWVSLMGLLSVAWADHNGNWTKWSDWSACSRTCDGGASYQLRRCLSTCDGENIRYRTCNNQACPEGSADFRQQQCAAYNDVPFQWKLYQWEASIDPRDPCALSCRPKGHNSSVVLAPKVLDGTRCYQNSNSMCINGVCRAVGCDNILGSGKIVDHCGICGGDGSSCARGQLPLTPRTHQTHRTSQFVWKEQAAWSGCSVSCGVGVQMSLVMCFDQQKNVKVSEVLCDAGKKPSSSYSRACQMPRCGPVWITGEWTTCSKSCGGGLSLRHLYCVEEVGDGSFRRFYDSYCSKGPKPASSKPCNSQECPIWYAGQYSPCSVTCGLGVQKREVICRKSTQMTCSDHDKPKTSLPCYMGPCIGQKAPAARDRKLQLNGSYEQEQDAQQMTFTPIVDINGRNHLTTARPQSENTQTHKHKPDDRKTVSGVPSNVKVLQTNSVSGGASRPKQKVEIRFEKAPDLELAEIEDSYQSLEFKPLPVPDSVFQLAADGAQLSVVDAKDLEDYASGIEEYDLEPPTDDIVEVDTDIPTTPSFIEEPWSACTVTCGQGTRTRRVQCKVYLEFSRTVEILNDRACTEHKPPTSEQCYDKDCNTATGREEIYFAPNPLTGEYVWKPQGFSQCSSSCLGGKQRTTHRCSRVAGGLIVDDSRCQGVQRPPVVEEACNVIPCPPYWRTGSYGPCSALCGGGFQRRYVECVREYAHNQVEVLQDSECPNPFPPRSLLCNPIDCPPTWHVKQWSQCSVTCGEGVERREVICQQITNPRTEQVVDGALCAESDGPKPMEKHPCLQPACPTTAQTGLIKEVDLSRTVQMLPRRKLIVLVGGETVIIPGTTLQVKCPVEKGITQQWFRETQTDPLGRKGRIRVTKHGLLHIKKGRDKDAGVYHCIVQGSQANITINFHSEGTAQEQYYARLQFLSEFVMSEAGQLSLSVPAHADNAAHADGRPLILSVIGAGDSEKRKVPPLFYTGEWSRCSSTCGGAGLQTRNVTCELIMEDYYKQVGLQHCALSGMEMPLEAKDCGFSKCPHWEFGNWGECANDKCSRYHTGTMERPMYCVAYNNSLLSPGSCEPLTDSHMYIRECRHNGCEAIWKTLSWTRCSRSCGDPGVQSRVIRCVWQNNGTPAGINCDNLERPHNVQQCQPPACNPDSVCQDESKYCDLARMLKLCRYKIYRVQCCRTCSKKRRKRQRRRRQKT